MSGAPPRLPGHVAMGVVYVPQIPYSAIQREHERLISEAAATGAGTLIRGGVVRGAHVGRRSKWVASMAR
jgi:hypothetical protein